MDSNEEIRDLIHIQYCGVYPDYFPVIAVCHKTGVTYSFQVRGMLCAPKIIEGFIIPLQDSHMLYNFKFRDCELGCWGDEDDVDKERKQKYISEISKLLSIYCLKYSTRWTASIDLERISELEEGWWPINLFYNCKGYKAYIHLGNCT